MMQKQQQERARQFRQLNEQGNFILANAWDIASARVLEAEGMPALGTTSGGIAYARGFRDAQVIGRDAMLAEVAAIAAAVALPVTADIEAGYAATPQELAQTIRAAIEAGAVGVNLEDRSHDSRAQPLFSLAEQTERLAAARAAATQAALSLWINARTDTYLLGLGNDAEARFALTVERANAYLAAGADMVFVPGLADLATIRRLVAALKGPLNLMAMPGAPTAPELFAAGVGRVSLGVCPMLAVMGLVRDIAREARATGSWEAMTRSFYGFAEAEALFAARLPA